LGVSMDVEPRTPMYKYIQFSFENNKYVERFKELNKEFITKGAANG
jgi:hypothetical protein